MKQIRYETTPKMFTKPMKDRDFQKTKGRDRFMDYRNIGFSFYTLRFPSDKGKWKNLCVLLI